MRIWKDGDETRAICPVCERRTDAVLERRTVVREAPDAEVPAVLVAVCRECDATAFIPHQSTPKIRAAVERSKQTLNVRVPGHLTDVLLLLADRSVPGARGGTAAVLRMLLHEFGSDPSFARRVKDHLTDPLASGPADHDLSVRVPLHVLHAVDDVAELVGMGTRSDVVRALLVVAKHNVLDGADPSLSENLRRALAATA